MYHCMNGYGIVCFALALSCYFSPFTTPPRPFTSHCNRNFSSIHWIYHTYATPNTRQKSYFIHDMVYAGNRISIFRSGILFVLIASNSTTVAWRLCEYCVRSNTNAQFFSSFFPIFFWFVYHLSYWGHNLDEKNLLSPIQLLLGCITFCIFSWNESFPLYLWDSGGRDDGSGW